MLTDDLVAWYLRSANHPFKDKIVGRYWGWFTRRPLWIRYDGKFLFKANLRDYVQQAIFFQGYYEPMLVEWLKANLRPSDVFWDVGANVGAFTLLVAPLCKQVFAFEPEPATRMHLLEHVTANRLRNVTVLALALADSDGVRRLFLGPEGNTGMHSLVADSAATNSVEVDVFRADALLEEGRVAVPNVMKVDVEGAELSVFKGSVGLLRRPELRAVVFETKEARPGVIASEEVRDLLQSHGFEISVLGYSDDSANDGLNNFIAARTA